MSTDPSVPASHPDPVLLARVDDADPDVADADVAAARSHAAGCPTCTAVLAGQRAAKAALAALPPVTMPPDVAERLDAALTASVAAGVEPAPLAAPVGSTVLPRPSTRRLPTLPAVAAGIVVLALLAAVGIGVARHQSAPARSTAATSPGTNAAPQSETSSGFVTTSTGTAYTAAALTTDAMQLLVRVGAVTAAPHAAPLAGSSGQSSAVAGTESTTAPAPSGVAAVPTVLLPIERSPSRLVQCIGSLETAKATLPLAIDFATYAGKPAIVVVLPDPEQTADLDVWVVGPRCGEAGQPDLVIFKAFAKPAG